MIHLRRLYVCHELFPPRPPPALDSLRGEAIEENGPYFYNKGLHDARAILHKRMDDISGAIVCLEKPTSGR
jgi:hypothetical protein